MTRRTILPPPSPPAMAGAAACPPDAAGAPRTTGSRARAFRRPMVWRRPKRAQHKPLQAAEVPRRRRRAQSRAQAQTRSTAWLPRPRAHHTPLPAGRRGTAAAADLRGTGGDDLAAAADGATPDPTGATASLRRSGRMLVARAEPPHTPSAGGTGSRPRARTPAPERGEAASFGRAGTSPARLPPPILDNFRSSGRGPWLTGVELQALVLRYQTQNAEAAGESDLRPQACSAAPSRPAHRAPFKGK